MSARVCLPFLDFRAIGELSDAIVFQCDIFVFFWFFSWELGTGPNRECMMGQSERPENE